MYVVRDYPDFSWSSSRHELFEQCERKYFYNYYAGHRGWEINAPNRKVYALKHLTNLHLVFGSAVHSAVKNVILGIVNGKPCEKGYIDRCITDALREACRVDKKDWWMRPAKNHYLMELAYYGGFKSPMGSSAVNTVNEKRKSIEANFYASKTYQELSSGDIDEILEVDEELKNESVSRFELDGVTVFAKVDFLYHRKSDGKTIIVDWKTDRSIVDKTTHNRQLGIYAYYVNQKYGIPVEDMVLRVEGLVDQTIIEIPFSEAIFSDVERFILGSVERMKSLVADKNTSLNKPLPMSSFRTTEDKGTCKTCKFRVMCFPNWK